MMKQDTFYPSWEEQFLDFCANVLDGWALHKTKSEPDYQARKKKADALEAQIELCLGENKGLLQELLEAKSALEPCASIYCYLQGYRDCIFFLRRLELL